MPAKKSRHINLLPKEDFERTTLGRIMKWALTSFRFIVIVVELVVISGFLFRFYLDVRISNLDDEIQQKSALISSKSSFEKEFRQIKKRLAIYSTVAAETNDSLPILQLVSESLPTDTQLVSFTREKDLVRVVGTSLNEASIASLLASLEEKEAFGTVTLQQLKTVENSPAIEFSLEIVLIRETI